MKCAAIQMVSSPDVAENVQTAARLVRDAAAQGVELAVLPEYFCLCLLYTSPSPRDS